MRRFHRHLRYRHARSYSTFEELSYPNWSLTDVLTSDSSISTPSSGDRDNMVSGNSLHASGDFPYVYGSISGNYDGPQHPHSICGSGSDPSL